MGLVLSRREGEGFWVGEDWFQVATVGPKGCTILDRKGVTRSITAEGPAALTEDMSVQEGIRKLPNVARLVFSGLASVPIWREELRSPETLVAANETEAALLAPVPYEHLVAGLDNVKAEGKVAFGSRAW